MKEYVYKGIVYTSISKLAKATGISSSQLTKMLEQLPEKEGRIEVDHLIDKYLSERNQKYRYKENTYRTIEEAAKAFGLSDDTLRKYLSEANYDLEKAMELYDKKHVVAIIDGVKYTSKVEIAKSIGVAQITLNKYVEQEGSIEAAYETLKNIKDREQKEYIWNGETYDTYADVARAMRVPYSTLKRIVNNKTNGDLDAAYQFYQENVKGRFNGYTINGIEYSSIKEMLKDLDIPSAWYWEALPKNQNDVVKTIYGLLERQKIQPKKQYYTPIGGYIYKGKAYRSIYQLAGETGISQTRLTKMVNETPETDGKVVLDRPIDQYIRERDQAYIWIYKGEPYSSVSALAREVGLTDKVLHRILKKMDKPQKHVVVDKAIERYNIEHNITYLGRKYDSIKELAEAVGIEKGRLSAYIKQCDGNAEKAVMMINTKDNRKKIITKDGNELNLADLALVLGIKQMTLKSCIDRGMTIAQVKARISGQNEKKGIKKSHKAVLMYDEKTTLLEYCIKNKLNYRCINYAVTECGKSIPDAINHYRINGQDIPLNWMHERYDVLLKHILLDQKTNYLKVLDAMRRNQMSLREALEYVVVRTDASEKGLNPEWQHEIYSLYTESGISEEERQECVKAFYITPKEIKAIEECKEKVDKLERQLDLYEIAECIRDHDFKDTEMAELMKLYQVTPQELKTIFYDFYIKFQNGVLQTGQQQQELQNNKSLKAYATEKIEQYERLMHHEQDKGKEDDAKGLI